MFRTWLLVGDCRGKGYLCSGAADAVESLHVDSHQTILSGALCLKCVIGGVSLG